VNLAHLASATKALKSRADTRPLDFVRWTPPQKRWLSDPSTVKLLRGGNQCGKTHAQAAETIWRCMGTHPFLETHPVPIEAWMVVYSWEQSLSVQQKVYDLLPKDALMPDVEYTHGRGFRGKTPIIRFKNGSVLRFKTCSQGTLALASSTIHYCGVDEPPPRSIFGELAARILRTQGVIGLTMTPVGRNDVGWLRQLVEDGQVSDTPAPLTVENCTVEGGLSPMLTQAQIDEVAARYLPIDRDARLLGAWECANPEACFDAFDEHHISEQMPPGGRQLNVCIGIDHGADAGSEFAVLTVVDRNDEHPRIWVIDEYSSGAASETVHAAGILEMLTRNGLRWEHVDRIVGDRAYGGKRWGGRMSNSRLIRSFEQLMKIQPGSLRPSVRTAWKPRGSVYVGVGIIHASMVRDNCFSIHPRCTNTISSLRNFDFRDGPHKHAIDSLRYSLEIITKTRLYAPNSIKMY